MAAQLSGGTTVPYGKFLSWRGGLAIEPPLLVILVGLAFALCVVPGLVEDLEEDGDAARG